MKLRTVLGILVVGAVVVAGGLYVWATRHESIAAITPPDPGSFSADEIEHGAAMTALGGCESCHTRPGGERLAGGFELPTPFGVVVSTNITPDPQNGIGQWSLAAFTRAMRDGLDREGNHLYPAFPYDHFDKTTDGDLQAIYAYLMTQPAVNYAPPPSRLPFPLNIRPIVEGWKLLFHRAPKAFEPDPSKDEEWNRGAYLVQGLGHCGACHSPRNMFGAVVAGSELGGAEAEGWYVPPIGAASRSPVPWDEDAYVNYFFDGWDENHGIAGGPMVAVIDHFNEMTEDDVFAIAKYMVSLHPAPAEGAIEAAVAKAAELDWKPDERPGGAAAPTEEALLRGEKLFFDQCVDCHKARVAKIQPASLALTPSVVAADARNLAHIIVNGLVPPHASVQRSMPGQNRSVNDQDIADILRFVRWRYSDLPPWDDIEEAVALARGHGS